LGLNFTVLICREESIAIHRKHIFSPMIKWNTLHFRIGIL